MGSSSGSGLNVILDLNEFTMRDIKEMKIGNLKPTHMLAVVAHRKVNILEYQRPMTPEFSVRKLNLINL